MPGQEIIGRQLGDYTIVEKLGHGGMAHVYKGYDANLQRYAAVKVIEPDRLPPQEEAEYRERFLREARAIARLSHPRIVGVYQFGQTSDNLYYMAMQFVDGRDLRFILKEYMRRGKRPGSRHILRIMKDIASALDYAHKNGVIHRDVKPSNIMIAQDGSAILTDFGLVLTASERTMGNAFGSVHYVAPEQAIASDKAVAQSDLYALGVVLFEIMTGRVPFDDASGTSVAIKHIQEAPPLPRSLNSDISLALEDVILKLLDKSPSNRYHSGAEFITALEAALTGSDNEDTQELENKKLDSKSRPIILPDLDLLPSETQTLVPLNGASPLIPEGNSRIIQKSVQPIQPIQKPLSATPTPTGQRTKLELDPVERQKIQDMPTITDSSKSSQLRDQMNAKLRTLSHRNRGGMGVAVGGIALALIIGVLTVVLLGRDAADSTTDFTATPSTSVAVVSIGSDTLEAGVIETAEATVEPSSTRTPRPTTTPTTETEETSEVIGAAITDEAADTSASPTLTRTHRATINPTSTPAPTDAATSSRPRATSTRQAAESEEVIVSPENVETVTVDPSLPSLDMEDGEGQVMLRYDGRSLVLLNRAPQVIDVSDLDFVIANNQDSAEQSLFNSTDWDNPQIYLLRNANCFQLWTEDFRFLKADEFPADVCDYRQAYQQIETPFWVGEEGSTFTVERDGFEYGVCPVVQPDDSSDNRCIITLPDAS
jgi:serine/threonine protein kinase